MKQKRERHLRANSRAAQLFVQLVEDADDLFTFGHNPVGVMKFGLCNYKEIGDAKERKLRRQALKRLKYLRLISERKTANQYIANITRVGMQEYFRLKLSACDLLEDNDISVVVFDIPESQQSFRKSLRRLLKEIGFIQIQKSVWISPFDVCEALTKIFGKTKKRWIRCFIAKEIR